MKLRQLEAIRAVMASGTTTHAAELMGLTQSAVSRLVAQLEEELGLSIFDRRHGRLQITPEGQQFYDVAKKVLAGIDQIDATARDIRTLQAGALRILAMPALAYGLRPRLMSDMANSSSTLYRNRVPGLNDTNGKPAISSTEIVSLSARACPSGRMPTQSTEQRSSVSMPF